MSLTQVNRSTMVLALLLATTGAANANGDVRDTYAQQLVQRVIGAHPEVQVLTIEAVPKAGGDAVVLASTQPARVGAGAGAISVPSGVSVEISQGAAGGSVVAQEALQDVSGVAIGLLVIEYSTATDRAAIERSASEIREMLRRRIAHVNNLSDPIPYEPDAPANTYAQQLVDEFLQKHSEIEIMAIHATPPGSDYNVIAGSSIGRLGKKADNDDMRCVYTGKPNLEVNSTGTRFESEMQLHDRSGRLLGALGVVVAYKKGDSKEALHAHAEAIRQELEARIPDAASLFRPGNPAT